LENVELPPNPQGGDKNSTPPVEKTTHSEINID
jgi:hypothetical protein